MNTLKLLKLWLQLKIIDCVIGTIIVIISVYIIFSI